MTNDGMIFRAKASEARRQGVATVRGVIHGLIFTIGLWLALAGLVLLIFRS